MHSKDLSNGKPWKVILLFALPMVLSVTLQQVYNIADSMIAGNMISENALGAISASYPVTMLFLGLATGAGIGTNVIVSRYFGMKRHKELKTTVYTSLITFITFSFILGILGVLLTDKILIWLNTDAEIISQATTYLRLYCFGMAFLFLYNITTFIFQALGNSKTPLYFLIFSTSLNIFLNILFVKGLNMGIFGIALATLIAQGIASIAAFLRLLFVLKKIESGKPEIYSVPIMKSLLSISIPSMIQGSIVAIGGLFVQGEINKYGTIVTAGYGAAYKLCYIVINIIFSLSNALGSYTSQNIGAGKRERIMPGYRACLIITTTFAIISSLVFILLAPQLLQLFLKNGQGKDVLDVGVKFLYIVTPFYVIVAVKICFDGVLKGAGDMLGFMIGTLVDLLLRIGFTYVFSYKFGYEGIWWSWPVGWVVAAIAVMIVFSMGRWKKVNKLHLVEDQ